MEPETATVTDLITALETATFMAKQLPSTTTAADSANIYASLHAAHRHLSLFLAHTATASSPADLIDAPMQFADEENNGGKEDSKIESVEERMRDCFIQNKKRLKRSLSPTSLAAGGRRRWLQDEIESARVRDDFDPHVMKLRALDLIYQFHC